MKLERIRHVIPFALRNIIVHLSDNALLILMLEILGILSFFGEHKESVVNCFKEKRNLEVKGPCPKGKVINLACRKTSITV